MVVDLVTTSGMHPGFHATISLECTSVVVVHVVAFEDHVRKRGMTWEMLLLLVSLPLSFLGPRMNCSGGLVRVMMLLVLLILCLRTCCNMIVIVLLEVLLLKRPDGRTGPYPYYQHI